MRKNVSSPKKHGKQAQWHAQLTIYDTRDKCECEEKETGGEDKIKWNDIDDEDAIVNDEHTVWSVFMCFWGAFYDRTEHRSNYASNVL